MKYVAVVVTFNRKEKLIEALKSLLKQTVLPTKIVLVDNHSTDGTEKYLIDHDLAKNPLIEIHRLPENIGGSGGFYEGTKLASKMAGIDWIALSDDDAIYEPDYFEKIQSASLNHPDTLAFSGTVVLEDGRIQNDQRGRVFNEYLLKRNMMPAEEFENGGEVSIDWFSFCGCVIKANLVKKIGLPEQGYFIWWDDFEYSLRIRQYSKLLNVNGAHITHKTAVPSLDTYTKYTRDWRTFYNIRNRILAIKKHAKSRLLINLYFVYWYPRLLSTVLQKQYQGSRWFVLKQYNAGFWAGYLGHSGKNFKHLPAQK